MKIMWTERRMSSMPGGVYTEHVCRHCGGSGEASCPRCGGTGTFETRERCYYCNGRGYVKCDACGGRGVVAD